MGKLIATLLRALADVAETRECDRPEDIVRQLIEANAAPKPDPDTLSQLTADIDTMQQVIGTLSLRLRDLEHKQDPPATDSSLPSKGGSSRSNSLPLREGKGGSPCRLIKFRSR